jgi:hypothetical protein
MICEPGGYMRESTPQCGGRVASVPSTAAALVSLRKYTHGMDRRREHSMLSAGICTCGSGVCVCAYDGERVLTSA